MRTWVLAALFSATTGLACSSSSAPASTPSGDTTDAASSAPTTFTQVYSDVISQKCVSCHHPGGEGVTGGMLDMSSQATAYTNLVGVTAAGVACGGMMKTRVVPNEPDSSVFYLKISLDDPTPCGAKMPLGGPALSQTQADEIESWINGGAKND